MKRAICLAVIGLAFVWSSQLWASPFAWADLTSVSHNTVSGTITLGAQTIGLTFASVDLGSVQINNKGTSFWSGGLCGGPCPVYNDPADGIAPPNTVDVIEIHGNSAIHTFTFSSPVTNPVMAIVSLGQGAVYTTYYFDHPFVILTSGGGYWGGGYLSTVSGNGLQGHEGDGLVEFPGTFSEISWTGQYPESWNGFTIGGFSAAAPEPGSLSLFAGGVLALAGVFRQKFSR